ncbi:MAG: hypothetical protein JJU12_04900 [Chlamydiales bacterium]|nr:hypothetical protein [Chlamydiales bacterium]
MSPPVAVFGHKRPQHLKACLEAVRCSEALLGKQLPLYIYCDAARNKAEAKDVETTLAVAREFGRGEVIARKENFGFRNITEGISSLCEKYGKVIVLEDDVLISPDFLPFIVSALEKYQDNPEVFMVSGFMYFAERFSAPEAYFLNLGFIWGWATWSRAWKHYDYSPTGWEGFVKDKQARYMYDCLGSMPFSASLRKTLTGQWKAWAPQWAYAMHRAGGVSLYPQRSLVWNCGCGGGTHGDAKLDASPLLGRREYYIHGTMEYSDFKKPRLSEEIYKGKSFPKEVKIDKKVLRQLAIIFLKERLETQEKRKRWRLYLKLNFHKLMARISAFPSF